MMNAKHLSQRRFVLNFLHLFVLFRISNFQAQKFCSSSKYYQNFNELDLNLVLIFEQFTIALLDLGKRCNKTIQLESLSKISRKVYWKFERSEMLINKFWSGKCKFVQKKFLGFEAD